MIRNIEGCCLLVAFSIVFSCEEPEPYFNEHAVPPEEYPLNIQEIKEGQHIAGIVRIVFAPEIPLEDVRYVLLFIDETSVSSASVPYGSPPRYYFDIDTRQWSEGNHDVSIGIIETNPPDLGLLNLVESPSIIYTAPVVFDQTPPASVILETVEWNSGTQAPRLSWQKNNDLNFYAYIVFREEFLSETFVDTVYNQDVTSYDDFSLEGFTGISCKYRIIVTNRDQLAESNEVSFTYPETFPLSVDQFLGVYPPIESADGTELFTLTSEGVKAVALSTNTIVRTYLMPNYPNGFGLSKDGTKLYVLSTYSPGITVLNAATFEVITTAEMDGFSGKNIVCGRSDRLYISTSWPFSGPLKILDASTLTVVGSLDIEAPGGLLAISSDNNTLYVADPNNTLYQSAKIYSIDVSTDAPSIIHQQTASDEVRAMELSADDETLFVIHDYDYPADMNLFVDCWHASDLTSYKKLSVPDQAFTLSSNAQTLCVVYGARYLSNWSPGGVYQYDIATGTLVHDWKLRQTPYKCLVHSGNDNLYLFGFTSWVIPLNGP